MKSSLKRLLLIGSACLLMIFVVSCVQIPTDGINMPVLKAKVRIINTAADLGSLDVKFDGKSVGTLAPGKGTNYQTVNAGRYAFQAGSEAADTLAVTTDFQGTYFVATKNAANSSRFLRLQEHLLYKPVPSDQMAIFVAQMCPDASFKVDLVKTKTADGSTTTETLSASLAFARTVGKHFPGTGYNYTVRFLDSANNEWYKMEISPVAGAGNLVVLYNPKASLSAQKFYID